MVTKIAFRNKLIPKIQTNCLKAIEHANSKYSNLYTPIQDPKIRQKREFSFYSRLAADYAGSSVYNTLLRKKHNRRTVKLETVEITGKALFTRKL